MKSKLAIVLLSLALTSSAAANGRFPLAQQLVESPTDASVLVLRATFGLVISQDAGKTWHWVCEQAVGYSGIEDPAVGVTQSGAIIAGIFDGLRRSENGGCDFSFPDSKLEGRYAVDVTVDKKLPSQAYVLTSTGKGGGKFETMLWRSVDEGTSFSQLGVSLPEDFLGLTLDPAPSEPTRHYVSGLGALGAGVLYVSSDDGQSWTSKPVPGTDVQNSPFIGAVHPTDPLTVYLRVTGTDDNRLLVTKDGGETFQELFAGGGRMLGFALSPNGDEVTFGYGDPKGGASIDEKTLGLWHALASDPVFKRVHTGPVNCLTWTAQGLYVCGSQFEQGFELARIPDPKLSTTAPEFTELFDLKDVAGPLDCPSGSGTTSLCSAAWPALCELLDRCADAGSADAGTSDAGSRPPAAPSEDCGCRQVGSRPASSWWMCSIPLIFWGRRRQRQS